MDVLYLKQSLIFFWRVVKSATDGEWIHDDSCLASLLDVCSSQGYELMMQRSWVMWAPQLRVVILPVIGLCVVRFGRIPTIFKGSFSEVLLQVINLVELSWRHSGTHEKCETCWDTPHRSSDDREIERLCSAVAYDSIWQHAFWVSCSVILHWSRKLAFACFC